MARIHRRTIQKRSSWPVVLEKTPESPLDCKEIQPVNPKGNQKYSLEGQMLKLKLQYFGYLMWRTDSLENWCWERLKAGGEGDDRGWDSWMASLTQWTWVWVRSRSWWWTGKPGVLQSMESQRVGHDWATELNSLRLAIPGDICKIMVFTSTPPLLFSILLIAFNSLISSNVKWE